MNSENKQYTQDEYFEKFYQHFKNFSRYVMGNERAGHTSSPTEIVHEVFIRMKKQADIEFEEDEEFIRIVCMKIREAYVDNARAYRAKKRGGNKKIKLYLMNEEAEAVLENADTVLLLEDITAKLIADNILTEQDNEFLGLRVFGRFTFRELGEHFAVSESAAARRWKRIAGHVELAFEVGD